MYRDHSVPLVVLPSNFVQIVPCNTSIYLAILACNRTLPKTKTIELILSLHDLIFFEQFITSQDYDGFCLEAIQTKFSFFSKIRMCDNE